MDLRQITLPKGGDVAACLIEKGARLDCVTKASETALTVAKRPGWNKIVALITKKTTAALPSFPKLPAPSTSISTFDTASTDSYSSASVENANAEPEPSEAVDAKHREADGTGTPELGPTANDEEFVENTARDEVTSPSGPV